MRSERLTVEVPSIDTDSEYEVGQELRIQRGQIAGRRSSMSDLSDLKDVATQKTWFATVVATGSPEQHRPSQSQSSDSGTLGYLGPIEKKGYRYARRIVVELHSDHEYRIEAFNEGDDITVYNRIGDSVALKKVIKVFDVKDMSE